MNLDAGILAVSVFLALWGAVSGASGQISGWVALPLGWLAAKHGAAEVAPHLERASNWSPSVCTVVSSVGLFFAVSWAGRALISRAIRKVLGGGDGERRGLDRALGLLLGGGRSLVIAWLCLSAWAFAETHVRVSGKPVGALAPPRGSQCYAFAKAHNAFGDAAGIKLPAVPALPKGLTIPGTADAEAILKRGLDHANQRSPARQVEQALEGER